MLKYIKQIKRTKTVHEGQVLVIEGKTDLGTICLYLNINTQKNGWRESSKTFDEWQD